MRKVWLGFSIFVALVSVAIVSTIAYERRDNAFRVKRAHDIVRELRQLEIGKSDLPAADAIAKKFGNAPLPEGWTKYPDNYCASPNRSENCVYLLSMNNSPFQSVLESHPHLRRLGFHEWTGSALILLKGGKVTHYRFTMWYRASNSHLRGFGAGESQSLPRFEPDLSRISDSYGVLLFHTGHTSPEYGLGLESMLTPSASESEQQRASHIDFGCLAGNQGCGEICEIMPDAWRDFYERRGRFDVKGRGPDFLLCNDSQRVN